MTILLKNDEVDLKLNEESFKKLVKFNSRIYDQNVSLKLQELGLEKLLKSNIIIFSGQINQTNKTKTKYLILTIAPFSFTIAAQLRYVKLKYREPKHPLTNVFSDFWRPKLNFS